MNMVTTITTEVTGTPHRRPLTHPQEIAAMLAERAGLEWADAALALPDPCCPHEWYEHLLPEPSDVPGWRGLPRAMRYGGCALCDCPVLHADGEAMP